MTDGPVYALVQLSYEGKPYRPGERVDLILPSDVLAACLERGEVSRTKPKA